MSLFWIGVVVFFAPLIVYGLTRVGAAAWFNAKRAHTKSLLEELSRDN